ncbi:Nramp family divalent metal transporter [Candidatus Bathyarchaeota archaeon]|nr:Nramp family divalent metal transporter [Candidatus Bathyarchaeota archaeon]
MPREGQEDDKGVRIGEGPPLRIAKLPPPPRASHILGPGIVLAAMGIGMGEMIMWPRMTVMWGNGVLWLALLGFTIQYFVQMEMSRWVTATGESFFQAAARMGFRKLFSWIFFLSAPVIYFWPGWIGTAGQILSYATGEPFGKASWQVFAVLGVIAILIILTASPVIYNVIEKVMAAAILISSILVILVTLAVSTPGQILGVLKGFISFGYWHPEMSTKAFMPFVVGAIAYAGPSGMQQAWYTLWCRDRGMGMGAYVGRITGLFGRAESIPEAGYTFDPKDPGERGKWRGWRRYCTFDALILFWAMSIFLTFFYVLLAQGAVALDPSLVKLERTGKSLAIISGMGEVFTKYIGPWAAKLFYIVAFLQVWNSGFGVYDGYARGQADILYYNLPAARKIHLSKWYYIFLYGTLLPACAAFFIAEKPLALVTMATWLAAFAMAFYCPILAYVTRRLLPEELRPSWVHTLWLLIGAAFYWGLILISLSMGAHP